MKFVQSFKRTPNSPHLHPTLLFPFIFSYICMSRKRIYADHHTVLDSVYHLRWDTRTLRFVCLSDVPKQKFFRLSKMSSQTYPKGYWESHRRFGVHQLPCFHGKHPSLVFVSCLRRIFGVLSSLRHSAGSPSENL